MNAYLAHRVAMEPDEIEQLHALFPQVEQRFVPWRHSDPCGICKEDPNWEPNDCTARIVYGRGDSEWETPVGFCCAAEELVWLLNPGPSRTPVDWARLEFMFFESRADGVMSEKEKVA